MINPKQSMEGKFYPAEALIDFACRVLEAMDVPASDAKEVSDCLVGANLRGIDSHGIVRLPVYARRLQAGVVNSKPDVRVVHRSGCIGVVDGDNALGPVVGAFAIRQAISIAKEHGMGLVVAQRSNHFGAAAHFVSKAIDEGCIGIASSNAPPNMAPWGGKERFLGTNPIAVGIPTGERSPIIFDMATSVVARGKIILAAQEGEKIPEGWAIDPEGRPTTDAKQALLGAVLPFGGAKGSAISLLVDIFSGALSGASYGRYLNTLEDLNNEQNLGHFFLVIDVRHVMEYDAFTRRVDDVISQLKVTPTAYGVDEVLAPGEPEERIMRARMSSGIMLTMDVIEQLQTLGNEAQVGLF